MNIPESLIRVASQPVKLSTLQAGQAFKLSREAITQLSRQCWSIKTDEYEHYMGGIFVVTSTRLVGYQFGAFHILGELRGFDHGDFDVLPVEIVDPSAS